MLNYHSYNTRKKDVDMAQAALLVIDMQNHFQDLTPSIIGNINKLIDKFHSIQRPVIFTQYHDDPKDTMLSEWWPSEAIEQNTDPFEFVPDLHISQHDVIIPKTSYDSFFQTYLEEYLIQHNTKEIVIVGVLTNCCCETTARSAFVRNYRVHFIPDANTTYDEALHQASLSNLAYAFAYLPLTAELL